MDLAVGAGMGSGGVLDRVTAYRDDARTRSRGTALVAGLVLMGTPLAPAQQQVPECPYVPPSTSDPGTFDHTWAGLVFSVCTIDGLQVWTGEDGGRIRHRHPTTGLWTFTPVPHQVRGTIRKIHMLENQIHGWAVSEDGWILCTPDGGNTWATNARMEGSFGLQEWEDLYGIWMAPDGTRGVLLGTRGIWFTENGGYCWERSVIQRLDSQGTPVDVDQPSYFNPQDYSTALYSLAVRFDSHDVGGGVVEEFLGLAVGKPGVVLRSDDFGQTWLETLDIRSDPSLPGLMTGGLACLAPLQREYDSWDVAIGSHGSEPLALVVGGRETACGLILASVDDGFTWSFERHECEGDPNLTCASNPLYEPAGPTHDYRHQTLKTLYGVAIFDDTNGAVAVGYNGQHLVRDLVSTGGSTQAIWRDRSVFGPPESDPVQTVLNPLWRTAVAQGTDIAWLTGIGGHARRTQDAGQTWEHVLLGEPYRTRAVYLKSNAPGPDRGWIVGQGYRVAYTDDGGETWTQGTPDPVWAPACYLQDITFAGNLEHGVAVGCARGTAGTGARILYTATFATTAWETTAANDIDYGPNASHYLAAAHLRRVAWSGDSNNLHFIAAGDDGLILQTTNAGAAWDHLALPSGVADPLKFQILSVAATGGAYAVFVGAYDTGSGWVALAWGYDFGQQLWHGMPIDAGITGLQFLIDVAFQGTDIHAVGQRNVGGNLEGIVLRFDHQAGEFKLLEGPFGASGVPECSSGGDALPHTRTLARVAFDPAGNLWIAGQCGRIWELPASSSTWVDHKSQTGADITSLQFLSAGRGYINGHGQNQISQCLVRLDR